MKGGELVGDLEIRPQGQENDMQHVLIIEDLDKDKIKSPLLSKNARQAIAACLIGVMLAGGSIYYYNYRNTGYAVKYQGTLLGYVRDKESAVSALASVKDDIKNYDPTINVSDDLTFDQQLVNQEKIITGDYIKNTIVSGLYAQYTSYSITLNGTEIAVVKNEEEVQKILDGLRNYYAGAEEKNGAEVLKIDIKDEIKATKKIVNATKLVDPQKVVDTLIGGKGTTKKYQVQSGDTIWKIAKDNNMKIQDIAAVNPGLNVERLQVGQEINLSVSEPYLNVETTVKLATSQDIPYDTNYVTDGNLYRGQSQVVKSGEYGINKITREVTKVNGVEVASSVLSSEIVKQPVTRILAKGTKELVGTGRFMWPSGGVISSAFGSRGREFHKGLDIAAPIGSPIYAADSGTVILAGRYYDYGKLVIIDHGNGYTTYYGHCSSIFVSEGETVTKGQKIAAIGMTGQTTGPHVHFEVRKNGSPVNPLTYLK